MLAGKAQIERKPKSKDRTAGRSGTAQVEHGKYSSILIALTSRIKGQPGNPYWNAFEALTELTGLTPWEWPSHWSQQVHQAAIAERQRRGEVSI